MYLQFNFRVVGKIQRNKKNKPNIAKKSKLSQILKLGCIWCRNAPRKNWDEKNKKNLPFAEGQSTAWPIGRRQRIASLPTARRQGRRQRGRHGLPLAPALFADDPYLPRV
jgi:hypothetical protein